MEVIPTQTVQTLGGSTGAGTGIFEIGGRSRARVALESLGEALITTDTTGCIDYANPAAAALLGVDGKLLDGRTLDQVITLVDETDRKLLKDPIDLALRGTTTIGLGRARIPAVAQSRLRAFDRAHRVAIAQSRQCHRGNHRRRGAAA